MTSREIEALCRGFLHNAAARQWAAAKAEPENPSAEYLTGFGAGWEAGQVSALALVVSMLSDTSATQLVVEAMSQAAVEATFPVEFHWQPTEGERA